MVHLILSTRALSGDTTLCKVTLVILHGVSPCKVTLVILHGEIPCKVTPVILHGVIPCKVTLGILHGVVSPDSPALHCQTDGGGSSLWDRHM